LQEWSYRDVPHRDMASGQAGVAMRLAAVTGLDLHVIDLGGGLAEGAGGAQGVGGGDRVPAVSALLAAWCLTGCRCPRTGRCSLGASCRFWASRCVLAPRRAASASGTRATHHLGQVPQFQLRVGTTTACSTATAARP
jgi:pyruvate,water dikinase